jgi:hypothetical protein
VSDPTVIISISSAIISALTLAAFQDIQKHTVARINNQEFGWRNKYNIHLMSGVSQKQIYNECGVLEELIKKGVIEKRHSQSRWGKQKHQYRLSFFAFFKSLDSFESNLRPK